MHNTRFKAGIIGVGNIGFGLTMDPLRRWPSSHLQAYKEHPAFEPVAVCDINTRNLRRAKEYLPGLHTYTSWVDMLREEKIDILSVCVSTEFNFKICHSPLLTNVRALILEKPLARRVRQASYIVDELNSRHIIAAVNYFRRWQETFRIAKELIGSGMIGKICKVNAFYPAGIYTGGSHMIDSIIFLLGDFSEIKALRKFNVGSKKDALYSFTGRIGDTEVYFTGFNKKNYNLFEMELWGVKGKISISDFCSKINIFKALPSRRFSRQRELTLAREIKVKGYNLYFRNLLNNMRAVLEDKRKKVLCTPKDALKSVAVIEAVEISYASSGKVVNLNKEFPGR